MTIYRCDKCSREDEEEYPPCVYIQILPGRAPEMCPYKNAWNSKALEAEWEKCDKIPEDVKL